MTIAEIEKHYEAMSWPQIDNHIVSLNNAISQMPKKYIDESGIKTLLFCAEHISNTKQLSQQRNNK